MDRKMFFRHCGSSCDPVSELSGWTAFHKLGKRRAYPLREPYRESLKSLLVLNSFLRILHSKRGGVCTIFMCWFISYLFQKKIAIGIGIRDISMSFRRSELHWWSARWSSRLEFNLKSFLQFSQTKLVFAWALGNSLELGARLFTNVLLTTTCDGVIFRILW